MEQKILTDQLRFRWISLVSGPACFALIAFLIKPTYTASGDVTLGLALWMACWWITEAVPPAVTSLLPLVIFPSFGIVAPLALSQQYSDPVIFLFLGGFIIGFAIEKSGLHQVISSNVLRKMGRNPVRILVGIMMLVWMLSSWISNTATTLLMLPAVLAIIRVFDGHPSHQRLASVMLIGLAYSASIGGMSTPVGTPPNMVFIGFYTEHFPLLPPIGFFEWSKVALPVSFLLQCFTIFLLVYYFKKKNTNLETGTFSDNVFHKGSLTTTQRFVLGVFLFAALAWITRSGIQTDGITLLSWNDLLFGGKVQDSTIGVFAALLLLTIPFSNTETGQKEPVVGLSELKKVPYDIILLFGGGFALSNGFEVSGLSQFIADKCRVFEGLNSFLLILAVCTLVTIISEFASNVASIQLVLPVLLPLSESLHLNPLTLMIPATLSASLGFMLPVATAPNTIVYGSGFIKASQMMKYGFWVNLGGVWLITMLCYWVYG